MQAFDTPPRARMRPRPRSCSDGSMGTTSTSRPGHAVFPFGFLLSLQAKSKLEMAKGEPCALSHELWRRREPPPAAPYLKRPSEAKDHTFDRERGENIPASWLKSHARCLVRCHLHPETKFQGGEYDQRSITAGIRIF